MFDYLELLKTDHQDQMTPDFDRPDQVKNNADGYVFKLDDWKVLDRFLILGSESNTYYSTAKELTIKNAQNILKLLSVDGKRVVDRIVEISQAGRAPKNNPAIFALALAASVKDPVVRAYALENMPAVVRTGTHLFQFVNYCNKLRGWGRSLRNTISKWYTEKDLHQLVYQVIKYRSRYGWSHKDVLRKAHPQPKDFAQNFIFKTLIHGFNSDNNPTILESFKSEPELERYYVAMNMEKIFGNNVNKAAQAIVQYDLPREAVPTSLLNRSEIWEALLEAEMPYTAMLRNLGKMSSVGILYDGSPYADKVINKLTDKEAIRSARVHPVNILMAKVVYSAGRGYRGSNEWYVNTDVEDALKTAFYEAFNYLEPTGKRHLIALDVSGSMSVNVIPGSDFITAAMVSAAVAMALLKKEKDAKVVAFSDQLIEAPIDRNMDLSTVIEKLENITFGATDCAAPMKYAAENNIPVDVFSVWTDSETWCGIVKPHTALQRYREKMGIDAKLVVCGCTATEFTIADPNDPGMLDVVGFDSAVPMLIDQFSKETF